MISNSEDFRSPITLPLKKETDLNVRAEPEGDTEAVATDRATKTYYQFNPQMDVLRQSGIIEVRAAVRKRPDENYGVWSFDVEPILTEKGKKFASGEQGARDTFVVPLAQKELLEVTGITKTGDVIAKAQYTWREVPTEVGRAFVLGNPEYQGLPASLQQILAQRNQTKEYGKNKRGTAIFQLYDDGWRLGASQ